MCVASHDDGHIAFEQEPFERREVVVALDLGIAAGVERMSEDGHRELAAGAVEGGDEPRHLLRIDLFDDSRVDADQGKVRESESRRTARAESPSGLRIVSGASRRGR